MSTYISPDGNPEMWDQKPNGYFTPEEWEADHPAPPPSEEEEKQLQLAEIKSRLSQIDLESVRPLRAKVHGTATPEDDAKLAALEQEAEELREGLAGWVGD